MVSQGTESMQDDPYGETQPSQTQTQTQPSRAPVVAKEPPTWACLLPVEPSSKLPVFNCYRETEEYTIGRSSKGRSACDFILESKKISGRHAVIRRENDDDGDVVLIDKSTNGTWINQARAPKNAPVALNQGDEVSFGPVTGEADDCRYIFRRTSAGFDVPTNGHSLAGGLFEHYDLRQQVGKGSFATVRAAIQRSTGKLVAVKIINKRRFVSNDKTMEMLRREVEICKTLRHPFVASFEDYFEDETYTYMVLEYVDGGDLLEFVTQRDGLGEEDAQEVARQVCTAVAYLHSQGVAHRDLKPDNLLMTKGPVPVCKITDFGLAKLANEATFLRTMCGTPSYLAPEVILQDEEEGYSFACDAWSIGVLVYAALANALPFDEDEKETLRDRMLKRQPDMQMLADRHVSAKAMDFVAKLMVFDPHERMTCAEALQHPWLQDATRRIEQVNSRSLAGPSISLLSAARITSSTRPPRSDAPAVRASVSTEAADDDVNTTLQASDSSEYRKQLAGLNLASPRATLKPFDFALDEEMNTTTPTDYVPVSAHKRKQPLSSAFSNSADDLSAREPARKRAHVNDGMDDSQ